MHLRSLFLFLVFFLNFIATSLVDSSHIEIELHKNQDSHIASHKKKISKSHKEHCEEHEDCHTGHYHYYIYLTNLGLTTLANESYLSFSLASANYICPQIEIIKPPLV